MLEAGYLSFSAQTNRPRRIDSSPIYVEDKKQSKFLTINHDCEISVIKILPQSCNIKLITAFYFK